LTTFFGTINEMPEEVKLVFLIKRKLRLGEDSEAPFLKSRPMSFLLSLFFLGSIVAWRLRGRFWPGLCAFSARGLCVRSLSFFALKNHGFWLFFFFSAGMFVTWSYSIIESTISQPAIFAAIFCGKTACAILIILCTDFQQVY